MLFNPLEFFEKMILIIMCLKIGIVFIVTIIVFVILPVVMAVKKFGYHILN
jgi:hypothetical protein